MKRTFQFKRFDAELDTDTCDPYNNAELTLTLKLGFRQINPAGGSAQGTYHDYGDAAEPTRKIIKWTDTAWSQWKENFVRTAQTFWNGKFWLINDAGAFAFTRGETTYYPNVWCRFALVGRDASAGGSNHTIDVVRLDPSERWFGSHSTLYDSRDTDLNVKNTDSTGRKVMQRAHVHEVGHLLGLNHVDVGKPHCPTSGNTNAAACYGVADVDMRSLMGSGMELREEHAYPWREALRNFALADLALAVFNPLTYFVPLQTLKIPIVSLTSVWPAKLQRHYPRTAAEVQAGTMITTRPVRPS